jgi:regulator of protease activity HflC (stomatin/prohibitin superfamily)
MCCDNKDSCTFKVKHFLYTFCGLALFLLTIVLISVTVNKRVEQDEFAVVYNNYNRQFGNIYEQGVYTLNVGDTFLKFKRTLKDVDIDEIFCITKDKIVIQLTISAQYQYNRNDLIPIVLMNFDNGDIYEKFLDNMVSNIILRQCGFYDAESYYIDRGTIYNNMYDALLNEINNNNSIGATIEFFQLKNIDFPKSFADAITTKQLVIQNKVTTMNDRTTQLILANTTLLQNQRQAEITIINANNQANININQAETSYNIILGQWIQRNNTYFTIMKNLNLNQSQLLDYLKSEAIRNSDSPIISI